jgi:hypothetical protein
VIRRWKNNGDANEDTYNIAYMVSMGKVIRAAAAKSGHGTTCDADVDYSCEGT